MVQVFPTAAFGNGLLWGACIIAICRPMVARGIDDRLAALRIIIAFVAGWTLNFAGAHTAKIPLIWAFIPWAMGFGISGTLSILQIESGCPPSAKAVQGVSRRLGGALAFSAIPVMALWGCSAQVMGAASAGEKPEQAKEAPRVAPAVDPSTPSGHKIDVSEGRVLLQQVEKAADPCDRAFRYTNAALSANNMQLLYHNAKVGLSACLAAFGNMQNVNVPPHSTDAAQAQIKDGLGDLVQALANERGLMDRLRGFANSDFVPPSEIEDYQEEFTRTQAIKNDGVAKIADALRSEHALEAGQKPRHAHHRHESS